MTEVLKKIQELHNLLEEKIAETDKLKQNLKIAEEEIETVRHKQSAASKQLSARERIIGKVDEILEEKDELKLAIKRNIALRNEYHKRLDAIKKEEKSLSEQEQEVTTMRELFKKKNAAMDELAVQLKEERKQMKERVLEEIKGKL